MLCAVILTYYLNYFFSFFILFFFFKNAYNTHLKSLELTVRTIVLRIDLLLRARAL